MSSTFPEPESVLVRIVSWAETRPEVRAVVLTSSRAVDDRPRDALSDYDVRLYAPEPATFLKGREWPSELGPVLLEMPPVGMKGDDWTTATRLVLYRDGTKIDFNILSVEELESAVAEGTLDAELEAGYRVLYDADGLARRLSEASGDAYRLEPPGQDRFSAVVEEFLWEATYVAKNLRREELLPARYSFECVMQVGLFRRMLEWRAACEEGWDGRPGVLGRGLQDRLPPGLWADFERTVVGSDMEDGWEALFRSVELFREVARQTADELDLLYPEELTDEVLRYLRSVRAL